MRQNTKQHRADGVPWPTVKQASHRPETTARSATDVVVKMSKIGGEDVSTVVSEARPTHRAHPYQPRIPSPLNPYRSAAGDNAGASSPKHRRSGAKSLGGRVMTQQILERRESTHWPLSLQGDTPVAPAAFLKYPERLLENSQSWLEEGQILEVQHEPFGFVLRPAHDVLGEYGPEEIAEGEQSSYTHELLWCIDTAVDDSRDIIDRAAKVLQAPTTTGRAAYQMRDQCCSLIEMLDEIDEPLAPPYDHSSSLFALARHAAALGARLIFSPSSDQLDVILPRPTEFQALLDRHRAAEPDTDTASRRGVDEPHGKRRSLPGKTQSPSGRY